MVKVVRVVVAVEVVVVVVVTAVEVVVKIVVVIVEVIHDLNNREMALLKCI